MEKRLLNIGEASEYLGIPVNTLRCWCSRKAIPYIKLGRMVRFDITQLEVWIKERMIEPRDFEVLLEADLRRRLVPNKET